MAQPQTQKFMGRNQMLERLGAQVGSIDEARRILMARGHMTADGQWTPEGAKRNAMTAEERAKDRAATATGHPAASFRYDPRTNRAIPK